MKGQIFGPQSVMTIEIKGESWFQGDMVEGSLKVKNTSNEKLSLVPWGVALARGDFKKVHEKEKGAFKDISRLHFPSAETLEPGQEAQLPFKFPLNENCPITDKKSSFFILYGNGEDQDHLQLLVYPQPLLKQMAEYLENFFRFKLKETKADKKGVLFKFKAPASRDMGHVDSLDLVLWPEGTDLHLNFTFQIRKIDRNSVVNKLMKDTTIFSHRLSQREHSLGKDMPNQEKILALYQEVVSKIKLKIFT